MTKKAWSGRSEEALEIIASKIKNHKTELFREYSIKQMGLFGSYLRDEQSLNSDLDILVDFKKPIDLFRFVELEEKLSNLLGERVDLVARKSLKKYIGMEILKEVRYL